MASVGSTNVTANTADALDTAIIAALAGLSTPITALDATTIINIVQDGSGSYTAFIHYSIA